MELTLKLNTFTSEATSKKIVSELLKCGITSTIKHTGLMTRDLLITVPEDISSEDVLELGVLIGTLEAFK